MAVEITKYLNGLQHIGIPCKNLDETIAFYKRIGVEAVYQTENNGQRVAFLKQGSMMIETYEGLIVDKVGAINHICFDVTDIEKTYEFIQGLGLEVVSDGICLLPFWKNGVKFFTISGPNAERIEYCQML